MRISLRFVALLASVASPGAARAQNPATMKIPAPELAGVEEWVNAKPFALKEKKGTVVVLHFWTFGCVNCLRNVPAYDAWHKEFAEKGVTVLGVHTPEFDGEKVLDRVRAKVKELKIEYPVAIDNSLKTWRAWENQYWPTVYLIDKRGDVRYRWTGELAWNGAKGDATMRKAIDDLLAEAPEKP